MARRIVVYGGTGGIGAAVARRLTGAGDRVHLVARSADGLAALADAIGAGWTAGDVATPELAARVMADLGDGPLDGLVYAVGTINLKPIARLADADFLNDFTVNLLGAARAIRAALPRLSEGPGASIVLFSSVAARQGFAAHGSTAAAKAAVEGLALSLAAELAPKIRVNVVAPSLTTTPLAAPLLASEAMARGLAAMHPLGRLGDAEDIAAAACFLLGPEASWVTGQILGVDGGRSALRTRG